MGLSEPERHDVFISSMGTSNKRLIQRLPFGAFRQQEHMLRPITSHRWMREPCSRWWTCSTNQARGDRSRHETGMSDLSSAKYLRMDWAEIIASTTASRILRAYWTMDAFDTR